MKVIKYPKQPQLEEILARPTSDSREIEGVVNTILSTVKQQGDKALKTYALEFEKAQLSSLKVSHKELVEAINAVDKDLKSAIKVAYTNIKKFHKAQALKPVKIETTKGVVCWRESRPIENVGLYIPGGSAPLFSTVLMLATPAVIAGCKRVVLCTPANAGGKINPAILYCATLCGVTEIYKVGGAQAIATMAYGTESIAPVNKIFGPGNRYVTTAKQLVQNEGIAIDMPAGPSEVMVVADNTAVPAFVAADLLSQAEHGPDSQVILVAFEEGFIKKVQKEVTAQLSELPILKDYQNEKGIKFIIQKNYKTDEYRFCFDPYQLGANFHSTLSEFFRQENWGTINGGWLKMIGNVLTLYAQSGDYGVYNNEIAINAAKLVFPNKEIRSFAGMQWSDF
jgi:histidinol dehydrogenase